MPIIVLFDLDDTLLHTNMGNFLPGYFHSLGQVFSHLATQEKLTNQIQYAVQKMAANQDPSKMLDEIFAENFYVPFGTTKEDCQEVLDHYYKEEFPKLRPLTHQNPIAKNLVQWCQTQSMIMAIATNPLFPETATRQRIKWAGLDPKDFVYFSSFNNFHFTKPNLTYYAECLGRLGWPEIPAVMIGDNLTYDLLPMEMMGYKTFLINPTKENQTRPQGELSDVKPWLRKMMANGKVNLVDDPEVLLAILRSSPAVMDTWLKQTSLDILRNKPSQREWSVVEVLWHLADYEKEVYQPQWDHLLADPSAPIMAVNTSNWAEERDYKTRDPEQALDIFMKARLESLSSIEALLEHGLFTKSVHHMVFTETNVRELVVFAAKHDRLHLRQCVNLLNIS